MVSGDWFTLGYFIGIVLAGIVGKNAILPGTVGCLVYVGTRLLWG